MLELNLSNNSIEDSLKKLGLKDFQEKVDSNYTFDSIETTQKYTSKPFTVIDRPINLDKDNFNRLADSIQIAFEGKECTIEVIGKIKDVF